MKLATWLSSPPEGAYKQLERDTGLSYTTVYSVLHYGVVPKFETALKLRDALAANGCKMGVVELMAELTARAAEHAKTNRPGEAPDRRAARKERAA